MSQTWVDSSMSTSFSPSSLLCKSFNKKQSWKNFAVNTPIPLSRFYHSYFILPALSWIYPSLSLCPSYPLPFNLQLSVLRLAAVHSPPLFGLPMAYGIPGSGIRFELWPKLQRQECWILHPLCKAGGWTCVPVLPRCHQSRCTTVGTPAGHF